MDGTIVRTDPAAGETAPWEPLERAVERLASERNALAALGIWRRYVAAGAVLAAVLQVPAWLLACTLSDELLLTAAIWAGILLMSGAALLIDIDRETILQRTRIAKRTQEVQGLLERSAELLEL